MAPSPAWEGGMAMQDGRRRVLDRIRKLMRVTQERGASEGEALAAALAAQRLIARYSVGKDELHEDLGQIVDVEAARGRKWQELLAGVVARNFRCRCWATRDGRGRPAVAFYGYRQDAEAARLVYGRLAQVGHREASGYARRREDEALAQGDWDARAGGFYDDFVQGFVSGVADAMGRQSQELMVTCHREVDEAFERLSAGWGRARRARFRGHMDADSLGSGYSMGRDSVMA